MPVLLKSSQLSNRASNWYKIRTAQNHVREREREGLTKNRRCAHGKPWSTKPPMRNQPLDVRTLAAAAVLRIRLEVDKEAAVVAPLSLASTSAPISLRCLLGTRATEVNTTCLFSPICWRWLGFRGKQAGAAVGKGGRS
jgi:phage terminase large subunit GpA-like protein